jgi:large subunit ribosomal protein L19
MADKDVKTTKDAEETTDSPKVVEEKVEEVKETPTEETVSEEETKTQESEATEEEVEADSDKVAVEEQTEDKIENDSAEQSPEVYSPKHNLPKFRVGDTVKVMYKIIEGDKQRLQPYIGIVIAIKGSDVSKSFTVRKIGADNIGVERIFPFFSPNIESLTVVKRGKVRRSKLYYLRDKVGKAAMRIKERK